MRKTAHTPVECGVQDPKSDVVRACSLVVGADGHRGAQHVKELGQYVVRLFLRVPRNGSINMALRDESVLPQENHRFAIFTDT